VQCHIREPGLGMVATDWFEYFWDAVKWLTDKVAQFGNESLPIRLIRKYWTRSVSRIRHFKLQTIKDWIIFLEVFDCLKNVSMAVWSVISSTYSYEWTFWEMSFVKSNYSSIINEVGTVCMAPRTTKYKPYVTSLPCLYK